MSLFRYIYVIIFSALLLVSNSQAGPLRVSPEWLKNNLHKENVVILDTRPIGKYQAKHIDGALNFPVSLTYQQKSKNGQIVETDIMQGLLQERGINKDKEIVVYDAGQLIDAARLFWALEVYGLPKVKVLSSGYDYWDLNNFPVSKVQPRVNPSKYVVSINHKRIASRFSTQLATKNPNQIVLDARDPDSYSGKKSSAKRFGHIPTAINIPVGKNIVNVNGIQSLLSIEKLEKLYASVPKNTKVITYCNIGRISSANYLVLRELGYDVSNYDASWREWGNDFGLPIEK